jgi:hypothetical protein
VRELRLCFLRSLTDGRSGGRQLDFARSGIEILEEVVEKLKYYGHWGDHFQVLLVFVEATGMQLTKAEQHRRWRSQSR